MPQSSLLAYFSKPMTAAVSTLVNSGGQEHITSEHVASVRTPLNRRQAIAEAARKQSPQKSVQQVQAVVESQKPKIQVTTPASCKDDFEDSKPTAEDMLRSEPKSAEDIAVPHLPGATISPVSEHHLPAIRRLTSTTLPVRYSEAFFTTAVTDPVAHLLSQVALYESEPVGWICCRLEPCSPNTSSGSTTSTPLSQIYVQALAVLSPYRSLGLATALLHTILSATASLEGQPICIYAHVWEKNEDALDWYAKRAFKRVMLVERYYMKLRPSGAWIVRRELNGA